MGTERVPSSSSLRAAVGHEPEHLVPDGVAGDRRAGLLDHPGVVTAKDGRELVLDHVFEDPAGVDVPPFSSSPPSLPAGGKPPVPRGVVAAFSRA
jgi:hypothetical protein